MPTHKTKNENKKKIENNKKPTYQELPVERITNKDIKKETKKKQWEDKIKNQSLSTTLPTTNPRIQKGDLIMITSGIYAGKTAEVYDQSPLGDLCVIIDDYLSVKVSYDQISKN